MTYHGAMTTHQAPHRRRRRQVDPVAVALVAVVTFLTLAVVRAGASLLVGRDLNRTSDLALALDLFLGIGS